MMTKNRHYLLKSTLMLVLAAFTFSSVSAQEEIKEDKVIKIKLMKDEDGKYSLDTTIVLDESFDGDWKSIIDDEEILKKLEEINIMVDVDLDEEGNVYMIKTCPSGKNAHFYSVDTDDEGHIGLKVIEENGESKVMVLKTVGDCKDKEHHVLVTKAVEGKVDKDDGDSLVTYTIKFDGEEGEKEVMIWKGDCKGEFEHDVIMKKMGGDSCKMIILSTGDKGEALKVIKEKEVIIITEDEYDGKAAKKKKKDKDD